jgi:hypothetical protein
MSRPEIRDIEIGLNRIVGMRDTQSVICLLSGFSPTTMKVQDRRHLF